MSATFGIPIRTCDSLAYTTVSSYSTAAVVATPSIDHTGAIRFQSKGDPTKANLLTFDISSQHLTRNVVIAAFNESDVSIVGTSYLTDAGGQTGQAAFKLEPGWNTIFLTSFASVPQFDWENIRQYKFYVNAAQYQSAVDPKHSTMPIVLDSIDSNPAGDSVITLSWDDGFRGVLNNGWAIISQFPRLKHTLNIVKVWTEKGYRYGFDTAQTLTPANVSFLASTGFFKIGNHSDEHKRYETGVKHPATAVSADGHKVAYQTGTDQAIDLVSGSGTFSLIIDSKQTAALPQNATQKQVQDALDATLGAGEARVTTGGSGNLTTSFGLRITFRKAKPAIGWKKLSGNLVMDAGLAYTTQDIYNAYLANRDYILDHGWGSSDAYTVAYPEGSYGPHVEAAMKMLNTTYGRLMQPRTALPYFLQPIFGVDPYAIPAINVSSLGVFGTMAAIDSCVANGGAINLMFHDVSRTATTQGNGINQADLYTVLSYVDSMIDRGVQVKTMGEYADSYSVNR
ncbi:MAG: hypothetical protein JST40_11020 [Armatimonadetes bacterium]|nr:hypothetical protein [Armatimonadota bacterium]